MADKGLAQFEKSCLELLRLYTKTRVELDEIGAYLNKPVRRHQLSREEILFVEAVLQHQPRSFLDGAVPPGLPEEMRVRASDMSAESLAECYQLDRAVDLVSKQTLTRLELISMHLCSYRNILELELSDQPDLSSRFLRLFNRVFTELMDRLYPFRTVTQSPEELLQEELVKK